MSLIRQQVKPRVRQLVDIIVIIQDEWVALVYYLYKMKLIKE